MKIKMKNILFLTDFSENAAQALAFAGDMASRAGASLILLHALNGRNKEEQAMVQMKALENWLKKKLKNKINLSSVIAEATLSLAVKSVEKRKNIDLIVMGIKGISGFGKVFFGSNASKVIETARIPVLAIPSGIGVKPIVNIAYATDYAIPDEPVVRNVAGFAALFDANLIFLHIIDEYEINAMENGRDYVNNIKNKINYQKISYHFVQTNDVIGGISDFVSENKIDVLALATHHKNIFEIWMKGSVTNAILNETIVPLLVQHKKVYEKV